MGAPPEITCLLDEIQRENEVYDKIDAVSTCVGADPELDEFMVFFWLLNFKFGDFLWIFSLVFAYWVVFDQETYCSILVKYKSDLSRPFDEATSFLSKIEAQLGDLCKG